MRRFFKRNNILAFLFIFIFIPGLLFTYGLLFGMDKLNKKIRPTHKLLGMTNSLERPQFDVAHFKSHEVQKYIEDYFAAKLPLRSTLIRFNNQIFYSFFNKSYCNTPLVIGKHKQIFEQAYIAAYCGWEGPSLYTEQQLKDWADTLKQLHDYYGKQNKTFIYVISPSKAEYMPEAIPKRFHCTHRGISRPVREMTRLLDERHVLYVNGPELMVEATPKYGIPMFVRGGTHWTDLGATVAANQIIERINEGHHLHLAPLSFTYELKPPKSDNVASDLLNLTNVLYPRRDYCAPNMNFVPQKSDQHAKRLSMIGGSFSISLFDIFEKDQLFPDISFYRYLKLAEYSYQNNKVEIKPEVNLTNLVESINHSDVIVLEENSQGLISEQAKLFIQLLSEYQKNHHLIPFNKNASASSSSEGKP